VSFRGTSFEEAFHTSFYKRGVSLVINSRASSEEAFRTHLLIREEFSPHFFLKGSVVAYSLLQEESKP